MAFSDIVAEAVLLALDRLELAVKACFPAVPWMDSIRWMMVRRLEKLSLEMRPIWMSAPVS
ncbi:MAG: hypothetical protein IPN64_13810 [Propionivibrio sp.]|nr:hypothetical protein [Propionivibrio sp.]